MKEHNNPDYLRQEVENGESSRSIAKNLGVSWKLVEIYLRKFNIKHTPYAGRE
jgi:hypothetical protein